MKLGRLAVAAFAVSVGFGSMAEAGNGSNYIHMLNGIDYFFGTGPYTGPPGLRGVWRCFPSDLLHSPTLVTDAANPAVGTYAAKVCAVHFSITASPNPFFIQFPTISLTTSTGKCHFLQSGGTAVNFGVASAAGAGFFVVGPLDGTISNAWVIGGAGITSPTTAPSFIVQLALNLVGAFGISSVPIPDGESLTLWTSDAANQTGVANRQYWTGSFDERNICSGYSFMLTGGMGSALGAIAFSSAWEWSSGIGTVDATMTNMVSVGASGGGPSGLNPHASSTAFNQPFDQGTGQATVSITGTTAFPATSSTGEILGFANYDESNIFGGSNRVVFTNLWKLTVDGSVNCTNGANTNPAEFVLATGGPGGPALSPLGNKPRVVAKLDTVALALMANAVWTAATIHGGVAGGSNIPWFPAAAGVSGSTGNTGGFAIPLPPLPTLVGVTLYSSSASLNASGTAIAALANNGHSHSSGSSLTFFP